jgi:DNA modification methylase
MERKWEQHIIQVKIMTDIIKKFGLSHAAMAQHLSRKMGVERIEIKGENYTAVQNDNIKELPLMQSNSVGLILTSIPFSMQYEYSPNYADYGHNDSNEAFFKQMDFSTPEAFRVLQPGRIAAIHVKDRIIPGGLSGLGFQTVYPFHMDTINHFTKHGFAYIGMKTIVTDVVRENNQTYRLGWTEQCKDGSKMGVGMPEYLLLFRKPPSDTSNAYADIPVVKEKREFDKKEGSFNNNGYSRARWQMDAHGYTRSSGDRLLDPEEIAKLEPDQIFKLFKKHSLNEVWDFEQVVSIAETLEIQGKLPSGFMLLQPQSWSDDVWSDITRMRTLNGSQWSLGKEMHICPMQFDIADRVIEQMSNPGDLVLDYFGGLMTVPLRAIKKGRKGYGIELNPTSFLDGANYLKAEELKQNVPTLFDLEEV